MKPHARKLYICHTLYHVYVSILKIMAGGGPSDILLVSTIPEVELLAGRIRNENLFGRVEILNKADIFLDVQSYHANHIYARLSRSEIRKRLGYVGDYRDVFLFNDYTEIGAYLNMEGIPYHLIEDGLDCYKVTNQRAPHGKAQAAKKILNCLFDVPMGLSQGRALIDIEVNDASRLSTKFDCPVIEKSRCKLMSIPNDVQAASLFRVFDALSLCEIEEGSVLILTDPLSEIGASSCDAETVSFFAALAAEFSDCLCYVKPHPRDYGDYSTVFPPERVINKNVPIELLNYLGEDRFEAAVTYSSTAIYLLSACNRRMVCDPHNVHEGVEHIPLPAGFGKMADCD